MNTIKNFSQLEDFVSRYIKDFSHKVLQHIRLNRIQMLEKSLRRELLALKRFQTGENDRSVFELINAFQNRFQALLSDAARELDAYKMPEMICDLAEQVDKEIYLEQEEERFLTQSSDSNFQQFIKFGKRFGRSVGRAYNRTVNLFSKRDRQPEKWKQTIPLRTILCYFQARNLRVYTYWMRQDLSFFHKVLLDYRNVLSSSRDKSDGRIHIAFSNEKSLAGNLHTLLKSTLDDLETHKKDIREQVMETAGRQEAEIIPILHTAGTIESTKNSFFVKQAPEVLQALNSALDKTLDRHLSVAKGLNQEIAVWLAFSNFGVKLINMITRAEMAVEELLKNSAFLNTTTILNEIEKLLNTKHNRSDPDWGKENKRLGEMFDNLILDPLNNEIQQERLAELSIDFTNEVMVLISDLPIEYTEIKFKQKENSFEFETHTYELNKLVARFFKEEVLRELKKSATSVSTDLEQLAAEARQALDVIEINLQTAEEIQQKQDDTESPNDIARDGLKKAVEKLQGIRERVQHSHESVLNLIQSNVAGSYNKLLHHMNEKTLQELKWQEKGYQLRGQALDWKTRAQIIGARVQDYLAVRYRFISQKMRRWYRAVAPWLGFPQKESDTDKKRNTTVYLSELTEKVERLPYVYRRLFDTGELADERFYINRPAAVSKFHRSFDNWNRNLPGNFAVVGEQGSGKSSLVRKIISELDGPSAITVPLHNTVYKTEDLIDKLTGALGLKPCNNVDEFVNQVKEQGRQQIVVLDDIQNAYIRDMHGYEAMEALLLIITQTAGQYFWVVTVSRYAWAYLDKVVKLGDYFSQVSICDTLTVDELKQLVLKRHSASGYDLKFEPSEEIKKSGTYKKYLDKGEEIQQYLKSLYFNELARITEGNASIALTFWLRSIKEFDDEKVTIIPFNVTGFDDIEHPTPDMLFTLAALVLHDKLTVKELAIATNNSTQESMLALLRLQSKGILNVEDANFSINLLMYRQILRMLKQRNIIHLTEV